MALMNLNALGMTLGAPLFQDLNLTISKGDRIGLIAANGRGKSTLLRCLADDIAPTTGSITKARGLRLGFVPQGLPADISLTLYNYVLARLPAEQADFESWRVDVLLDELSVPYELQHKPLSDLSGGWQRTALLAATWITQPDLLLLDEPTNHLDLRRIALLEHWIQALHPDVPMLITSHDRAFLDTITNRTLFLRPEGSRVFQLPFTLARSALDEADASDARKHANDLNKAQQLRRQAAKLKNIGSNSGSDLLLIKTKHLSERAEKLEAMAKPAHRETSAGDIRLVNSGTHAKALLTLDNVPVQAPDGRALFNTGRKWISRGDRVVLLGHNGAGKSQFVRRIQRAFAQEDSHIKHAASMIPAYSDQHLGQLTDFQTPMEAITNQFDVGDRSARSQLAAAGIEFEFQDKGIKTLSGGQQARLAMLVLRLKHPNFYLLDEPTNHLDIDGQEALESELIHHDTSCLLVSHNRQFIRNVGNRFWVINGKKLDEIESPEAFLQQAMQAD